MNLTRLIPDTAVTVDLEDPNAAATLAELYRVPRARWMRLNLIASVNGNASGADGTSEGLTSRTDRRILGAIRRLSDVVLVGASSVRKEGYLLPKTAPLAIVTRSGDLRGHQIPESVAPGRVIVLCPPSARAHLATSLGDRPVTVIPLPGPQIELQRAIAALRALGHHSIVCEGGPSLASRLIDSGLIDEICLSTSPLINDTDVPVLQNLVHATALHLKQLLVDQHGVLYARWWLRQQF